MKSAFHIYSEKLEKILCKYMEHIEEGSHLDGYEMADLIREVSGNELDAEFVEMYLKYVETGRGGKILKWDIKSPYDEETKMKITREGSENNPRFKLMEEGFTLKEIEKWFGKETVQALVQYCDNTGKSIDDVAGDDSEWDRFEVWSKSKKRKLGTNSTKFNNWQRAARVDDYDSGKKARTYDGPSDSDIYGEGSGSRMNEWDIAGWLEEELQGCEWVNDLKTSNDDYEDPWFEVDADGSTYRITVKKVFSPREGR